MLVPWTLRAELLPADEGFAELLVFRRKLGPDWESIPGRTRHEAFAMSGASFVCERDYEGACEAHSLALDAWDQPGDPYCDKLLAFAAYLAGRSGSRDLLERLRGSRTGGEWEAYFDCLELLSRNEYGDARKAAIAFADRSLGDRPSIAQRWAVIVIARTYTCEGEHMRAAEVLLNIGADAKEYGPAGQAAWYVILKMARALETAGHYEASLVLARKLRRYADTPWWSMRNVALPKLDAMIERLKAKAAAPASKPSGDRKHENPEGLSKQRGNETPATRPQ